VGALRLVDEKYAGARLWFDRHSCRALLDASQAEAPDQIVAGVVERWRATERENEIELLGATSKPQDVNLERLQRLGKNAALERKRAHFVSGLMCESPKHDDGGATAAATTLCALSGSGHQDLFVTLRDLRNLRPGADDSVTAAPTELVRDEHLKAALLRPWTFKDIVPSEAAWMGTRKPTLRWDEGAERFHALRLSDPTKDIEPFSTELGAYALAANALACLPVVPSRRGPLTISSTMSERVDMHCRPYSRCLNRNARY
jgi:hypothetical protein